MLEDYIEEGDGGYDLKDVDHRVPSSLAVMGKQGAVTRYLGGVVGSLGHQKTFHSKLSPDIDLVDDVHHYCNDKD